MKIHLRILYGCDDRLEYVKDCVEVCKDYFDSIGITNSGPKEFYDKLSNTFDSNISINHLNNFLDIESARRLQLSDVPENDWVLWLDADERPSQDLLDNIRNMCEKADSEKCHIINLVWFEHCEGTPTPPLKDMIEKAEKAEKSWPNQEYVFSPSRLIKKVKEMTLKSNFGAHECFDFVGSKRKYEPYFVIHNKAHIMYYQSIVFSGFLNPIVHANANFEGLNKLFKSKHYIALKEFQKKHKTFTSNDIVRKLKIEKDETFKAELKELFLSFPSWPEDRDLDEIITFKFMNHFAKNYDLNVDSPYYKCGHECCKYKNTQL